MATVDIDTTQNIAFNYLAAGILDRIGAFFIDLFIIGVYLIAIFGIMSSVGKGGNWIYLLIAFIPALLYHLLMETFMDGQSLGKKALHIKVIKLDGSTAVFFDYIIRWIFRLVDISLTYGAVALFTILFNGKGQRLGDIIAGTAVVRVEHDISLSDTFYSAIEDGYEPRYPQVAELQDEDIRVIKEVLVAKNEYQPNVYLKLLIQTRSKIEKKIGVEHSPALTSEHFLQIIVKDYNAVFGSRK